MKLELARAKKRSARIVKRWAQLVRGAWQALNQKHLDDARHLQRFRYEKMTPKHRLTMPHRIFQFFCARAFSDVRDCHMLQILGVIPSRGDGVEFWCADDPLQTSSVTQELLDEASTMLRVFKDYCFQLVVDGLPPFVYRWKTNMTLSSVRNLLDRRLSIGKTKVSILHLNDPLKRCA